MALLDVFNRYDPAKRFARLFYRASQFVESAEANEQTSILEERIKAVGDSAFGPISVKDGGTVVVDRANGVVRIGDSRIWAGGYMHQVASATISGVSMEGTVVIGIAVTSVKITDQDDPSLKGIVTGTESDGEPLGIRERFDAVWATGGNPFYPIYTLIDGVLQNESQTSVNDMGELNVERHVDETHGSHIIDGFQVNAGGFDSATSAQTIIIAAGRLRAQGRRVARSVDTRLVRVEDPDLFPIVGEVQAFPTGGVVTLNNGPIDSVQTVTIIRRKTVSLTHQLSNGTDALPDTVYSIESVTQGGTTYANPGSYVQTGDAVDWSPGGPEPAPGSTYSVTYLYVSAVTPTAIGRRTLTLPTANAVVGLPVTVQYRYKLPRIDVIAVDLLGNLVYIKGVSNRYNPVPPLVPRVLAPLARLRNLWGIDPVIEDIDQRTMTEADVRALLRTVTDLQDQVSRALLERDIQERDPSSRRGYFVDPFFDDNQRDLGIPQDAAAFDKILTLPIDVTPQFVSLGSAPIMLPYQAVPYQVQPFRTGSQKINEFLAFAPLPGPLKITPAVDRWNVTNRSTLSSSTSSVVRVNSYRPDLLGTPLYGTTSASSTSYTSTSLASRNVQQLEFLRVIPIAFEASGFGPGEQLDAVTFDGIDVTASVTGTKVANGQGVLTGVFTIPDGVRAGTKAVVVRGKAGSVMRTNFVGQGTVTTEVYRQVTRTVTTLTTIDPVAQTFKFDEPRILLGVDVEFTAKGDPNKGVILDLRPVENGLPINQGITEGRISGNFQLGNPAVSRPENWTRMLYDKPTFINVGDSYAFALLSDDPIHAVAFARLGSQVGASPEGFDPRLQQWVRSNPAGGVMLVSSNAETWLPRPEADVTHRMIVAEFTSLTRVVAIGTFDLSTVNPAGISDILVLLVLEEPSSQTDVYLELVRASGEVIRFEPNSRLELSEYLTETVSIRMVMVGTTTLSPIVMPECQILWGRLKETASYVTEGIAISLTNGPVKVRTVLEVNTPGSAAVAVDFGAPGSWTEQSSPASVALGDGWVERDYLQSSYNNPEGRGRIRISGTPANRPFVRQLRIRATGA